MELDALGLKENHVALPGIEAAVLRLQVNKREVWSCGLERSAHGVEDISPLFSG
jgi:hypothetical protein